MSISRTSLAKTAGLLSATLVAGLLGAVPGAAVSGGNPAPDGAFRFAAKIYVGDAVAGCSGALIDTQWVITAATCFPGNVGQDGPPKSPTTATVGRTSLSGTGGHVLPVVDLLFRSDRNVVLAKLASPITDITPVRISTTAPAVGESLWIAGYGRTQTNWVPDRMHTATVAVQSTTATTFAILGQNAGQAVTCKGDAGGPAIRDRNGTVELVGLHHTSWQNGCYESTETRQGAVETRLDGILDWVNQRLRGDRYTTLPTQRRILDTRTDIGGHKRPMSTNEEFTLLLGDIHPGASAVVLNLVGVNGTEHTFLAAYATTHSGTSNLNVGPNRVAAVMATVPVGPDRTIKLRNNNGDMHVIVDLLGYYSASGQSVFHPADNQQVILDTRTATGGHQRPLPQASSLTLKVREVAGVPANATAVAVNVTGTGNTTGTFVALYAQERGGSSTLNLMPNEDRANQSIVGIADDGSIRVYNDAGQTHVIITVLGWFVPGDDGSRFKVLQSPVRITDTRNPPRSAPLEGGAFLSATASGMPTQANAVALNVTAVAATAYTYLTVWPTGATLPSEASTVNVSINDTTANSTVTKLGTSNQINIRNQVGSVHALADLQGYYTR